MSCLNLLAIDNCDNSIGGVGVMYVGKEEDLTAVQNTSTLEYTTFTGADAPVTINVRKSSVDFADAMANSQENGSTVYTTTVNATVHASSLASKLAVYAQAKGQPLLYVIAKGEDGLNYVIRQSQLMSDGGVHGRNLADGRNHTLVYTGTTQYPVGTITEQQLTTLLAVS